MSAEHATFLGMPPFPVAARAALADTQLRRNLAHATGTIRAKRAAVVAEVDDWEALRQRAAAIKDDTLAHLDEHLLTLEAALDRSRGDGALGAHAADACAVVADVAKAHGIREVVKVKSMATQEIELNEALAAQGISAWETDLAELIVQLGDDLPSHILVPAIHRNRSEIRDIFRDRMAGAGRPAPEGLTDDPAALASAARLHLREKFLSTRMAVSGANFAVAEIGHAGRRRVRGQRPDVPDPARGARDGRRHREARARPGPTSTCSCGCCRARSTGERMNPYTSTWSGVTPGDGPQEVHVVLLDNGRTACAGRRGRAAGAALHPLLGVPERLPGLRAGRWARLRLGLPRPDRRHPQPAAARASGTTRRSTRCRTRRRCAARAPTSARSRSTSPASWCTCAPRSSTPTATTRCPRPRRVAMRAAAWGMADAGRMGVGERLAGLAGRFGRGRRDAGWSPRAVLAAVARVALDPGPRPAAAAARVVPGLVAPGRPRRGAAMTARDDVLAAVRAALGPGRDRGEHGDGRAHGRGGTASVEPAVGRPPARRPVDAAAMLDLFAERVADYRATVTRCRRSRSGASRHVGAGRRGIRRRAARARSSTSRARSSTTG